MLAGWGLAMVLVSLFVMVSAVGFALPHASAIAMDRHRRIAGSASALLGLTQFALGAITAPLVGIGDVVAGTALGVTALGASADRGGRAVHRPAGGPRGARRAVAPGT